MPSHFACGAAPFFVLRSSRVPRASAELDGAPTRAEGFYSADSGNPAAPDLADSAEVGSDARATGSSRAESSRVESSRVWPGRVESSLGPCKPLLAQHRPLSVDLGRISVPGATSRRLVGNILTAF